jgi:hypothetical protein
LGTIPRRREEFEDFVPGATIYAERLVPFFFDSGGDSIISHGKASMSGSHGGIKGANFFDDQCSTGLLTLHARINSKFISDAQTVSSATIQKVSERAIVRGSSICNNEVLI